MSPIPDSAPAGSTPSPPPPAKAQGSLFGGIEDEAPPPPPPAPRYKGPMVTVAPEVPVPRLFTYALPPHLADLAPIGVRVKVPFGGRSVRGFVVEVPDEAPPGKLKEVQAVLDDAPVLRPDVLELARWAADYYRSALGEVLAAAVPKSVGGAPRSRDRRGWLTLTHGPLPKRLGPSQLAALEALAEGARTWTALREAGIKSDVLRRLEKAGLVAEADGPDGRTFAEALELTGEQTLVLGPLLRAVEAREAQTTLLFGVTGSGKTEIYLRAIARALELGMGAIVLVPEISLTPQTLARFRARFGDTVAVLHSQLSGFDRRKEWWRVHQGEARVVIGPRSAVWAPVEKLGLIVVDEEHEGTYKQESTPRYHARDLSVVRGQKLGIPILLGSATPSLESWKNALSGRYRLARMRKRPGGAQLPAVRIVDMGREWSEIKRAALLSRRLVDAIKSTLQRGERVLLFQNRRGYTTYLQCKGCGFVLKCRTCDVSLTFHRKEDVCVCHFCDAHVRPPQDNCPDCRGEPLSQKGAGTERIEQIAAQLFPEARVGRLDTDVVRGGQTAEEVLARFASGELNLLVGTQIIAKGLHVPEVTCVGVISADSSLALPDFRSSERTFQLIAQVAGRAGRGERAGTTVVQTFSPRHFSVRAAADHDYEAFAKDELKARESLAYPPYARLLKVLVRGPVEEQVDEAASKVGDALRALPKGTVIGVLGPVPSPRAYLSNKFRFQVLVKGTPAGIRAALACVEASKVGKGAEVVLDVDPYHLL